MAMVNCPKCSKKISDKSNKCIHCGYEILGQQKNICTECGAEINTDDEVCSKCGCPIIKTEKLQKVEVASVKLGSHISKQKILIIIVSILVVLGSVIGISKFIENEKKKEEARLEEEAKAEEIRLSKKYKEDLSTITYKMLNGGAKAESVGNLIKSVWSNCIWEKNDDTTDKYTKTNGGYGNFYDDFNDALNNLFSDEDFKLQVEEIEDNQKEVNDLMKKMKNPPKEWEEAYLDLKNYYDTYLSFTNLATDPSGNLTTYSNNFSTTDTKFLNDFNKMKIYLD